MQRRLLDQTRIHPAISDKIASYRIQTVEEVDAAASQHDLLIVGMKQNPFPRRARKLLDREGIQYRYLEYGSYLSQWRVRLPLKLWTGWPTFPMIFVKGTLIGGFSELEQLVASGELRRLLQAPRPNGN